MENNKSPRKDEKPSEMLTYGGKVATITLHSPFTKILKEKESEQLEGIHN